MNKYEDFKRFYEFQKYENTYFSENLSGVTTEESEYLKDI